MAAHPSDVTIDVIAGALLAARGNVTVAARALNRSRSAIYDRIKRSKKLQQLIEDLREERLDNAETSLDRAVEKGEAWAVCFILKTLGKDRGYVEKQITQHEGNVEPIQIRTITVRGVRRDDEQFAPQSSESGKKSRDANGKQQR